MPVKTHNVSINPQLYSIYFNFRDSFPENRVIPGLNKLAKLNMSPEVQMTNKLEETKTKVKSINKRNVYKSIVRNMRKYGKNHRNELIECLRKLNYSTQEIEHAFFSILGFRDIEKQKGNKHKFLKLLDSLTKENSVLTNIFYESLKDKLEHWNEIKHERITSQNLPEYKKIYMDYYNMARGIVVPH